MNDAKLEEFIRLICPFRVGSRVRINEQYSDSYDTSTITGRAGCITKLPHNHGIFYSVVLDPGLRDSEKLTEWLF
jgi:hypothetical protein